MGSKGGGTQKSTTTTTLPPEVLANYKDLITQAKGVAGAPLQQYQGNIVAPFTDMQNRGFSGIDSAQGAYQPYFNQSSNLINSATQQYQPTQFSADEVGKYESPYTKDVINATMANINQNNAIQQNQLQGNAIASGAWGGNRADLARNDLARQQALASNQTIAGLNNQNYAQALGQFNQANQTGMQAAGLNSQTALSGAGLQGALGNYAQQNALSGAGAQLQAGTQQQQLNEAQLQVPYQQFQQQQAYPFQTTGWLGNLVEAIGNNSGGTSTTTGPAPQQGGLFGFLGLKDGGSVKGYAGGGGIFGGNPYMDGGNNYLGIPDLSMSPVPNANGQPQMGIGESTLPKSSLPQQEQQKGPTMSGLKDFASNVQGIGKGIGIASDALGAIGPAMAADTAWTSALAGTGTFAASNAATLAATTATSELPAWLAAFFLKDGGAVNGYADGGKTNFAASTKPFWAAEAALLNHGNGGSGKNWMPSSGGGGGGYDTPDWMNNMFSNMSGNKFADGGGIEKYASGGWQSQPLWDTPLYATPQQMALEQNGQIPSGMTVGGLDGLNATRTNALADMLAQEQSDPMGVLSGKRGLGNINQSEMQAMPPRGVQTADSGMIMNDAGVGPQQPYGPQQGSIVPETGPLQVGHAKLPDAPKIEQPPQEAAAGQPPALTALQSELEKNKPELDKTTSWLIGLGAAMGSKNTTSLGSLGEGIAAGMKDYEGQKTAVSDYALKKAEADERAQQLAVEADRYTKMLQIQQEVADNGNSEPLQDGTGHIIGSFDKKHKTFTDPSGNPMTSEQISSAVAKPSSSIGSDFSSYFRDPSVAKDDIPSGSQLDTLLKPDINAKIDRILAGGNPAAISTRKDQRDDLLTLAHLKDPSYDETNYATRAAAMKAYSGSGKIGSEFAAFNTIMRHGPMAVEQGKEIANQGLWTPGNSLLNAFQSHTGDTRIKPLQDTLRTIASEKAKMLQGQGVVTDAAREESVLESYDSPEQLQKEIENIIKQTRDRAGVRQQQFLDDTQGHDSEWMQKKADSFIQPESRKNLEKFGIPVNNFYGEKPTAAASQPMNMKDAVKQFDASNPIVQSKAGLIQKALASGYSVEEIKKHLGIQ